MKSLVKKAQEMPPVLIKPTSAVTLSAEDHAKLLNHMQYCSTQAAQSQKMVEYLQKLAREHACERSSVYLELKELHEELSAASADQYALAERQRKWIARLQAKAARAKPATKNKKRRVR